MGVGGHIALAFAPEDEAKAIGVLNGEIESDSDDWLKAQPDYGLIRENWWEMHEILVLLAERDPSLGPIAHTIMGRTSVGEGPGTEYFLYQPDEMREIAAAMARVENAELERAIGDVVRKQPTPERFGGAAQDARTQEHLKSAFSKLAGEVSRVADNGWSMIGFMA